MGLFDRLFKKKSDVELAADSIEEDIRSGRIDPSKTAYIGSDALAAELEKRGIPGSEQQIKLQRPDDPTPFVSAVYNSLDKLIDGTYDRVYLRDTEGFWHRYTKDDTLGVDKNTKKFPDYYTGISYYPGSAAIYRNTNSYIELAHGFSDRVFISNDIRESHIFGTPTQANLMRAVKTIEAAVKKFEATPLVSYVMLYSDREKGILGNHIPPLAEKEYADLHIESIKIRGGIQINMDDVLDDAIKSVQNGEGPSQEAVERAFLQKLYGSIHNVLKDDIYTDHEYSSAEQMDQEAVSDSRSQQFKNQSPFIDNVAASGVDEAVGIINSSREEHNTFVPADKTKEVPEKDYDEYGER